MSQVANNYQLTANLTECSLQFSFGKKEPFSLLIFYYWDININRSQNHNCWMVFILQENHTEASHSVEGVMKNIIGLDFILNAYLLETADECIRLQNLKGWKIFLKERSRRRNNYINESKITFSLELKIINSV